MKNILKCIRTRGKIRFWLLHTAVIKDESKFFFDLEPEVSLALCDKITNQQELYFIIIMCLDQGFITGPVAMPLKT